MHRKSTSCTVSVLLLTGKQPFLLRRKKGKENKNWKKEMKTCFLKHYYHYHTPGSCFTVITMSRKTPIYSALVFSPSLLFYSLIGWLSGTRAAIFPRELRPTTVLCFPHGWICRIKHSPVWAIALFTTQTFPRFICLCVVVTHEKKKNRLRLRPKLWAWAQSQNKVGLRGVKK